MKTSLSLALLLSFSKGLAIAEQDAATALSSSGSSSLPIPNRFADDGTTTLITPISPSGDNEGEGGGTQNETYASSSDGTVLLPDTTAAKAALSEPSIRFVDDSTRITPLSTLLIGRQTSIYVDRWSSIITKILAVGGSDNAVEDESSDSNSSQQQQQQTFSIALKYMTYVDDDDNNDDEAAVVEPVSNGTITFASLSDAIMAIQNSDDSLYCGTITVPPKNTSSSSPSGNTPSSTKVRVVFQHIITDQNGDIENKDESTTTTTIQTEIRSYASWVVIIPIVVPWLLFLFVNIPLASSLLVGGFIGSCIVEGTFLSGFTTLFDTYLLRAASDPSHVSLIMFIIFMAAFGSLMTMSGGTTKMMEILSEHATRTRLAQLVVFVAGACIFFDPYVSIVLVGNILGPVLKAFPVSIEKFAYILDTTSLPVSSLVPVSTFFTMTSDLLQQELDESNNFIDELGISATSIMMRCIRNQLYPLLILILLIVQISSGREVGMMLTSENKALKRFEEKGSGYSLAGPAVGNAPPRHWNWWIPVLIITVLVVLSFGLMDSDDTSDNLLSSLSIWMTAAGIGAIILQLIFLCQTKRDGTTGCCGLHRGEEPDLKFLTDTFPSASTSKSGEESEHNREGIPGKGANFDLLPAEKKKHIKTSSSDKTTRSLLNLRESFECYLDSGRYSVPLVFALIASWVASDVYLGLGIDRIIAGWIVGEGIKSEFLPIVAFFSSFLLSCIVGSAYTTIGILIPIVTAPVLEIVDGSVDVFVYSMASMISGSVAGCYYGPFSETTILSGIISECGVRKHFLTKLPYAVLVFVVGSGAGTVPVSLGAYPDYAGFLVGIGLILLFIVTICRRTKSAWTTPPSKSIPRTRFFHFGKRADDEKESATKGEIKDSEANLITAESSQKKQQDTFGDETDPLQDLIEDGLLHASNSELGSLMSAGTPRRIGSFASTATPLAHNRTMMSNRTSSTSATQLVCNSGRTRRGSSQRKSKSTSSLIVKSTIPESDDEGKPSSPSLRTYLRTAEITLDKMIDEVKEADESGIEEGSTTDGSHTDDSLDNLMANIAHHSKSAIQHITDSVSTSDDDDGSSTDHTDTDHTDTDHTDTDHTDADHTDNGESTISGNGTSTAFTGVTSYTDDDEDDDESAGRSQMHSVTSSKYELNRVISSTADDSTAEVEASKASF